MIYFDSDVLAHYFIGYAPLPHAQAKEHVEKALLNGLSQRFSTVYAGSGLHNEQVRKACSAH